ncbi:hypothetical protein ACWGJ2_29055 [Streptomyces sp. NPDC054796]|uniref:Uncharacterized protein n=1 Tax=Streptomyces daliensis TaxID=299421 RepID=A0A8T4IK48_9ACTN|nr:hypothetical protein [Streptomyces daliensis]
MGIVICIAMMAIGGILTLGVSWDVSGVNLDVIGLILIAVGMIGLAAYISIFKRRRVQPPSPAAPVVEEVNKHHWE